MRQPLFRNVDAIVLKVPDLERALAFYQGALGHELVWKKERMAALRLGDTELVLALDIESETDLLVDSVPEAVQTFEQAGGTLLYGPADIDIGRVAVVADPFGNPLTLIDLSKGIYQVDENGQVTGVA